MDPATAMRHFEQMHETGTVSNDSIIAWYTLYSRHLPKMNPARSETDLVRTIALWMKLTDRGGAPEFPYGYKSALNLPAIEANACESVRRYGALTGVSMIGLLVGLGFFFVNWKIALAVIGSSVALNYVAYRLAGGAQNPDLMQPGTTLHRQEGGRVLE